MSSLKDSRKVDAESIRATERNTSSGQLKEGEAQQQVQEAANSRQDRKSPSGVPTRWLPKDYKQSLDAIQRLACLTVAIWYLVSARSVWEFIVILSVGYIDLHSAKDVLVKVLKAAISDGR